MEAMTDNNRKISSIGLKYPFAVVLFDDGIFHYVSRNKIKYSTSTDPVSVKWKNTFYSAKLIGYADEKACQLIIKNINKSVPLVCLERFDTDRRNCVEQNISNGIEYLNCVPSPVLEDISQDVTASNNFTSVSDNSKIIHFTEHSHKSPCVVNGQEESIYTEDIYTVNSVDVENKQFCKRKRIKLLSNISLKDLHSTSISQYAEVSPPKCISDNITIEDAEFLASASNGIDEGVSFNHSEPSEDSPVPNIYSSDESLFRVMDEKVPFYLDDSELLDANPSKFLPLVTDSVSEESGCSRHTQNSENLNLLDGTFSSDDKSNGSVFVPSPHWSDCDSDIFPSTPKMIFSVNIYENTKNSIVKSKTQVKNVGICEKKHYPKKHNYCTFCNKSNSNIERHLQQVHRDEEEVKTISNLPKNSLERRRLIGLLRLRGNFRHNSEVLHTREEFVVARRTNSRKITKSEYVICPKCKIFITKPALRRHYGNCNKQTGNRGVLAESRALFSNIHNAANEILRTEIFPVMKRDDVFEIIRNDKLLIIYGNVMTMKYKSKHHYDMIRARLRSMGRFLKAIKDINPNIFASIYKPCMFDNIVQVLNNFGEIDNIIGYYKKPTLPSNIGTALKYIGRLYVMECIKSKNESDKTDIEALLFLLNNGLEGPINKTSTESILHKNRQKKQVLPPTEDIKLLCEYLEKQQKKYYTNLSKEKSFDDWFNLLKLTLISILVFNRRRPGELERALLTDYENLYYINEKRNRDTFDNLSPEAKQAAESYSRFTIRGKLARGVPVLLSKENHKYLECLIKLRVTFEVLPQNPYIFGLPQKNTKRNIFKYLKAVPLMRKYSVDCGAENPNLLRATLLRKHVATKCAQMNLDTENVENLQNFLGHADKIHKEYYRQPIVSRDIINMSKVLEIAQGRSQTDTNNIDTNLKKRSHSSDESATGSSIQKPKRQRLIEMDLGCIKRRSWTPKEKETATSIFRKYIDENILPPMEECILARQNVNLNKRSPQQIRLWVQNEITRKKRQTPVNHWTSAEKDLLQKIFHQYLQPTSTRYPSAAEITTAISSHPQIQHRTPKRIKSQLQHLRRLRQKLLF